MMSTSIAEDISLTSGVLRLQGDFLAPRETNHPSRKISFINHYVHSSTGCIWNSCLLARPQSLPKDAGGQGDEAST